MTIYRTSTGNELVRGLYVTDNIGEMKLPLGFDNSFKKS